MYKIVKIDKTSQDIIQDAADYSKQEMDDLLTMIQHSNIGGLAFVQSFCGLFGFKTFIEGLYMIMITKISPVALLGGFNLYHIDATEMKYVGGMTAKVDKKLEEARYMQIFNQVDLSKNFYFSYHYDLTRSLQSNLTGENPTSQDMYTWNAHHILSWLPPGSPFAIKVIHGFVDQASKFMLSHPKKSVSLVKLTF